MTKDAQVRDADTGRWAGRDVLHDLEHEAAALAALAEQGNARAARDLKALGRYLLTRLPSSSYGREHPLSERK